jgi:hypothetical protein
MGHSRGFFHVRAMSALGEERTLEYITGTITHESSLLAVAYVELGRRRAGEKYEKSVPWTEVVEPSQGLTTWRLTER